MRKAFTVIGVVLLLAVLIQFFLAGSGAFDTATREKAFEPHRMFGYVVFVLAIVLTVVGASARLPKRLVGMAGLATGLIALQAVIAVIAETVEHSGPAGNTVGELVFGLHGVNGVVIIGLIGNVVRRSQGTRTPEPPNAAGLRGNPGAGVGAP